MKKFALFLLAFTLTYVPMGLTAVGCAPHKPPADSGSSVDRGVALAFAGGVGALAVLDNALADRMAKMPTATPDQIAKLAAQVDRLKRVRDTLALVRTYIAGESDADGRALLRDVLALLNTTVAELQADGVKLPPDAEAGLAALSAFFAGG
jgi:hypothetical protein